MKRQFKILGTIILTGILIFIPFNISSLFGDNISLANGNILFDFNGEFSKENIKNKFRKYNVSEENIDRLIKKIENKELLDSEKKDSKVILIEEFNKNTKVLRYQDGSIQVITVKDLPEYSFRSVSGGNYSSGSGYYRYSHVLVASDRIVSLISFRADFTYYTGGRSRIDNVYEARVAGLGVFSDIKLYIIQQEGSDFYPASAELTAIRAFRDGSKSISLKLFVDGHNRWTQEY